MSGGPLLPGIREFDRPRSGWPRWLVWVVVGGLVTIGVIVLAGFVGGVGPLRALGQSTQSLTAVAYRATPAADVIQVAVTLPASGLCRDDTIEAVAFERSNRVEIETTVTRGRRDTCPVTTLGGDVRWVDVPLDAPLASRTVIRTSDREPVPLESSR